MSRSITPDTYDPTDPDQHAYVAARPALQYDLTVAGVAIDPPEPDEDENSDETEQGQGGANPEGSGADEDSAQGESDSATTGEEYDPNLDPSKPSTYALELAAQGDTPPDEEEEVDLNELTVPELKVLLKERDLAVGGSKEELISRIVEFENSSEEDNEES